MKRIFMSDIKAQIYAAIKQHNDALAEQVAAKEITYEQFLKAAFPPNALSTIDKALTLAWEKSNAH